MQINQTWTELSEGRLKQFDVLAASVIFAVCLVSPAARCLCSCLLSGDFRKHVTQFTVNR